jgi:hypothetical protein
MVNSTSVIVMFDSGVSRSFIFAVYVERHNIPVAMLKCRMVVSFLRGDMPARQACPKVNILIRWVVFTANLIVLGMDWLSKV